MPISARRRRHLNPAAAENCSRRCLDKSPKKRWQAIGDVRAEIENGSLPAPRDSTGVAAPRRRLLQSVALATAVALVGAVIAGVALVKLRPAARPVSAVSRFSLTLPEGFEFGTALRNLVSVSPDGAFIAFAANRQLGRER